MITSIYGSSNYENVYNYNLSQSAQKENGAMSLSASQSSATTCETCKNRKYQDGSDEMVSFKTPTHISPNSAASAVAAHESEHVSNAYSKAARNNGKVLQASVSLQTSICPECGRSYVSGGTTTTQIKYYNEDNPYQQDLKKQDEDKYVGQNISIAV